MAKKTLNNTDVKGTRLQVPDVEVFGDGDTFKLICKASSKTEGWMKATKAMNVGIGVVVQVTTQQVNKDGTYALAEAITFVPGVTIVERTLETGELIRKIEPMFENFWEKLKKKFSKNVK